MIGRAVKLAFYKLSGPLLLLNGAVYRRLKAPRRGSPRVQLGPGQNHYLDGWINLDANAFTAKCDVWGDLRNKLPFRDQSIKAFYSHHVIEHLPDMPRHFRDVYRCLQAGGVYRVAGPNGDAAVRRYLAQDASWFSNFPARRQSIGGKLDNFIFCNNEHLCILTESYLSELLSDAGFKTIYTCLPVRETHFPDIFNDTLAIEYENDFETPHTLVLEAVK